MEPELLPWALGGLDPDADVLEIGPGYGLATDILRTRVTRLICVEMDDGLAQALSRRMARTNVTVVQADAVHMPLADQSFGAALCFTMLHHIPAPAQQDHRSPVPAGTGVLTCGVDVQADRLELELVGWGRGEESWSIEYRIIPGDPTGAAVWAELDAYLQGNWCHQNGYMLPVAACCIDSGYESQAVYDFCRTRYHRRIFAVKGQGGPHPVWPKKPTAKNVRGERPWMVGTDSAKATIMGRLRNAQAGTPGFSHFPTDRQQPYFEQLLGEALVTTYSKGQPIREWRPKKGLRHEALDARVYAYAALRALVSMGLVLDTEANRITAQAAPVGEPRPALPRFSRSLWMAER